LPEVGVTAIRETCTASCGDITPRSSLLRTHASIPFVSPLLRPKPRLRSLCRLLPAPAADGTLPTLSLSILPWLPGPMPRRFRGVHMPVASSSSSAYSRTLSRSASRFTRQNDFTTDRFFQTAAIPLCSGPQVCSPPRSFPPLRFILAGRPRLLHPSRTCFVASACIG
jgi:hypothetical protein